MGQASAIVLDGVMVLPFPILMTPPFMGDVMGFVSPSFYCLVHVVAVIWVGCAACLGVVGAGIES